MPKKRTKRSASFMMESPHKVKRGGRKGASGKSTFKGRSIKRRQVKYDAA
jgi:hypothetical protein